MTTVDTNELLDLVEKVKQKQNEPESNKKTSIDRFIENMGIEAGIDLVPNYLIFYYYRVKWDGLHKSNKKNKIVFFREFNKKFKQKRTGKQRYYLLNGETFDMSRVGVEEAKFYEKKYQNRKKEKNQKK